MFFSFDTGHAKTATKNDKALLSIYKHLLESQKCVHCHLYLSEDEKTNHLAFSSPNELEEVILLEELLSSNCQWLTMELDRLDLQKNQIRILENYCNRN